MQRHDSNLPPAGLGRRLMAMVYDGFLLAAIWFVITGIWVIVYPATGLPMMDRGGLEVAQPAYLKAILFPLLLLTTWSFYAWFWLHGGQTLGMRAWRLQVRDYRGRPLTPGQTLGRFLGAFASWLFAGGGWLVVLMPPHQTLHDRLSATETVVLPKKSRKSKAKS